MLHVFIESMDNISLFAKEREKGLCIVVENYSKSRINIASEASYVYSLSGQKVD